MKIKQFLITGFLASILNVGIKHLHGDPDPQLPEVSALQPGDARTLREEVAPPRAKKRSTGEGSILVIWNPQDDPDISLWQSSIRQSGWLESVADAINQTYAFPADVYLTIDSCPEPNAFWHPAESTIRICYELIETYSSGFEEAYATAEEAAEATWGAALSVVYHELGHAVIDLYGLALPGREEDAVDGLAAYLMLDGSSSGRNAVLNAATAFLITERGRFGAMPEAMYADTHSLNRQRYYDRLCLIYGSNPDAHADLVADGQEGYLPTSRARSCPDTYARTAAYWHQALAPHLRSARD